MGSSDHHRPAYVEDVDDKTGRVVRGTRRTATPREKPKVSQRNSQKTAEAPASESSPPVPEPAVFVQDARKTRGRDLLDKTWKKSSSTQSPSKQASKSLLKSKAQDDPQQYGIPKRSPVIDPSVFPQPLPIRPRAITAQPSPRRPQTVPIRPRAITEQAGSRRPKSSYGPPLSMSAYYASPAGLAPSYGYYLPPAPTPTYPSPSPASYFQYAKAPTPTDYFTTTSSTRPLSSRFDPIPRTRSAFGMRDEGDKLLKTLAEDRDGYASASENVSSSHRKHKRSIRTPSELSLRTDSEYMGTPSPFGLPGILRRRPVNRGPASYNLSEGITIETSKSGRQRRTFYETPVNAQDVQEEYRQVPLHENGVPLTAEDLRKQQRRLSWGSTGASDGSDDGNGEGDVTIRVTGMARVVVDGAEIDCNDDGEIEIKRNRRYLDNRRSESTASHLGENQLNDRPSLVDRFSYRRSKVGKGPGLYESTASSNRTIRVSGDARVITGDAEISDHSFSSDTDEGGVAVHLDAEEIRSSARRLTRKTTHRKSLDFDDPPSHIDETPEPESADEMTISDEEDKRHIQNTLPPTAVPFTMCRFCPDSMSVADRTFGDGPSFMAHFNSAHVAEDSLQNGATGAHNSLNSPEELPPVGAERIVDELKTELSDQLLKIYETQWLKPQWLNGSPWRPGADIQHQHEKGTASRRQLVQGSAHNSEDEDKNDKTVAQRMAKEAGDNETEDAEENSHQGWSDPTKQVWTTSARSIHTQNNPEPLDTDPKPAEQKSSDDTEEENRNILGKRHTSDIHPSFSRWAEETLRSMNLVEDSTPIVGQPSLSSVERMQKILQRCTSDFGVVTDMDTDILVQLPSFKRFAEMALKEEPQSRMLTEPERVSLVTEMAKEYRKKLGECQSIVDSPDTQPEQEISPSQRNPVDSALPGNEDDDTQSVRSDFSNASSLASIADSIFSHITGSSMSSAAGSAGAGERFVALLLGDSIIHPLCTEALTSIAPERFERNLRRMLKEFAVHLRKEALSIQQRNAAHFVRFRARNSAHILCSRLCMRYNAPEKKAEEPVKEPDDADSEDSSSNESEDQVDDLQHLELFIKNSKAIEMLREKLRLFVYPPQPVALAGSSEETPAKAETELHLAVNETSYTESEDGSLIALKEAHLILAQLSDSPRKEAPARAWTTVVEVLGIFLGQLGLKMPRAMTELPSKLDLRMLQVAGDAVTMSLTKVGLLMPPVPTGKTRIEWQCKCGHRIVDDFVEARPGGLMRHQEFLQRSRRRRSQKELHWFYIDLPILFIAAPFMTATAMTSKNEITKGLDALSLLSIYLLLVSGVGMSVLRSYSKQMSPRPTPNLMQTSPPTRSCNITEVERRSTGSSTKTLIGSVRSLSSLFSFGSKRTTVEDGLPLHSLSNTPAVAGTKQSTPSNHLPQDLLFLLLCYSEGRYATKLLQLDLVSLAATSDKTLFKLLRSNYYSMRRPWLSFFSLRTLEWIKFVHFEMYRSELVDVRKINDIPPPEHKEYKYAPAPPDVIPPVGDRHMMHLFQHPECADDEMLCLSRFPKKLKEKLRCAKGVNPGWGLQFVEGWDFRKIWVVVFILFGLGSVVLGVLWAVYKHSIQDAFAIASFMLTFAALSVGLMQALMIR